MMTAASIKAAGAVGYADYLESKTVAPERGDYYLGRDGVPAEAPGRWVGDPDALARVGITAGVVQPDELRALMEGRQPQPGPDGEPVWLRNAGPDGTRAGGIDVTFSTPKGVSVAWALGDDRAAIEAAHDASVDAALGYLRETVELTVRYDPATRTVPDTAAHLHAAAFTHTTARGVGPSVPDPQLHTHVVITSVERTDGSTAAVRSRPAFRGAREVGAFYRAHLAHELRGLGYEIEPAGKDGRYFRINGIEERAERAFSKRTEEVTRAAREFRATYGRDPERGELRDMAVKTRSRKQPLPRDRAELDRAWRDTGKAVDVDRAAIDQARHDGRAPAAGPERWAVRVEESATAKRAIFTDSELRTAALEAAAGGGLEPRDALERIGGLHAEGRVLDLADGRMTTARVRAAEQDIDQRLTSMAEDRHGPAIDAAARERGIRTVEQRLGGELSPEQRHAVQTITGPGRASILIGPAGTGKGVVIDAAAHAEQEAGRDVYGVAVAGRTAQRLGESAPALDGRTKTIDGFLTSLDAGRLHVDERTTVYVDEAGMGDTARLAPLVAAVDERGGRLVAIGDHRQLPAIGAGGMFEHASQRVPMAELAEVRRTQDPDTREAWRELREGDPAAAMAHYYARGDLKFADTREQAVEHAARRYDELAREHGHDRVALMSDASNVEIDTLNLRVQALRAERGELTPEAVEHPDGHRLHGNDRVVWTQPMRLGDGAPRVENGQRGTITTADPERGTLAVQLDSGRDVQLDGEQVGALRLAYAGHITREQGATVTEGVALTGGWQTSREGVYVQASRATDRIEFHVSREDLDAPGDAERVQQLAARVERSDAQTPSISQPLDDPYRDPGEQHGAERVERFGPTRPPAPDVVPGVDRGPEITP